MQVALGALAITCGLAGTAPGSTLACTIDGSPSAMANGQRATISHEQVTPATLHSWAYFTFAGRYWVQQPVHFTEDSRSLRRVLAHDALAHALRRDFGDGTQASGWTTTHRYSRPGAYRLSIAAYDARWQRYFPFDSVRIVIAR